MEIRQKGWPHTRLAKKNPIEYYTYRAMLARCFNKNNPSFYNYGGRGITVCKRWRGKDGFKNFLSDLGKRPIGKYSLDRIDNNKEYSPKNCRWTTWVVQEGNRSMSNEVVGVSKHSQNSGWLAYISIDGNRLIKYFRTREEAISQRKTWESTLL